MEEYTKSGLRSRFAGVRQVLFYGTFCCLAFILVAYFMACWSIRSSVKEISTMAVQEYSGERVEALMTYVNSANHSLRERNRAVWALGQIGDKRAARTERILYGRALRPQQRAVSARASKGNKAM